MFFSAALAAAAWRCGRMAASVAISAKPKYQARPSMFPPFPHHPKPKRQAVNVAVLGGMGQGPPPLGRRELRPAVAGGPRAGAQSDDRIALSTIHALPSHGSVGEGQSR